MSILPYELALIVSYMGQKKRVIGYEGRRPWKSLLPEREFFRGHTQESIMVMGRVTWETLLHQRGHGFLGRTNIVITRGEGVENQGCISAFSPEDALGVIERCRTEMQKVFVVGGAQIFQAFLPLASRLLISRVVHDKGRMPPSDAYFPHFDEQEFPLVQPGGRRRERVRGGTVVFEERRRITRS